MAIDWLRDLLGIGKRCEYRSSSDGTEQPSAIPGRDLSPEAVIGEYVLRSGLTKGRDCDVSFFVDAFSAGRLNYRDVRKIGRALSNDEKRQRGIAYRGILTDEYLDTLNHIGMLDPAGAALDIAGPASSAAYTAQKLITAYDMNLWIEFIASNALNGPCQHAANLTGTRQKPSGAPLLPLADCTHPEQCFCFYQARLDEFGEF